MTTPKHVPRFIPTLTEIVDPTSLQSGVEHAQPDPQAWVQQIQRALQPLLEQRLQQELEQFQRMVLADHWQAMRLRLQQDLQEMVRQAVAKEVALLDDNNAMERGFRVSTDS